MYGRRTVAAQPFASDEQVSVVQSKAAGEAALILNGGPPGRFLPNVTAGSGIGIVLKPQTQRGTHDDSSTRRDW